MKKLFDGKYSPVTNSVGFLEADFEKVINAYKNLESERKAGQAYVEAQVWELRSKPFEEQLKDLFPLTTKFLTRHIFSKTKSRWVVYRNNSSLGPDLTSTISFLSQKLNCQGIQITASEKALKFTLTDGQKHEWLNIRRSVGIYDDGNHGSSWKFINRGQPLEVEDTQAFLHKDTKEKFSFEALEKLCAHFDLRPFDEDFYLEEYFWYELKIKGEK